MLQARQLGTELYVGIHSDEAILEHKGPSVMDLQERFVTYYVKILHHRYTVLAYRQ